MAHFRNCECPSSRRNSRPLVHFSPIIFDLSPKDPQFFVCIPFYLRTTQCLQIHSYVIFIPECLSPVTSSRKISLKVSVVRNCHDSLVSTLLPITGHKTKRISEVLTLNKHYSVHFTYIECKFSPPGGGEIPPVWLIMRW